MAGGEEGTAEDPLQGRGEGCGLFHLLNEFYWHFLMSMQPALRDNAELRQR